MRPTDLFLPCSPVRRAGLSLLLVVAFLPPRAATGQAATNAARFQGILLPNVVNQPVPAAVDTLTSRRLTNIEVARVWMDDMPQVVLRQFPDPRTTRVVAPGTRITLVVVQPLPRLPDLTGWRTDRAQAYLSAIQVGWRLGDPQAPPDGTLISAQSRQPGPVMPGDSVFLTVAPLPPPDTVVVQRTDTLRTVDTLRRADTVRTASTDGRSGGGVSYPLAGLLTVGGLGLGLVGARAFVPRPPRPSPRGDGGPPETDDGARRTPPGRLPALTGEIVDELVWVSKGRPTDESSGQGAR